MNVHRIRLRGPWHYEWLSHPEHQPKNGRVSLPQEWRELFGDSAGDVRFRRTFHCPTSLATVNRVDLVFEGIGGAVNVCLNGQELAQAEQAIEEGLPIRFEIGDLLLPTNDLQVEIGFQPDETQTPGGLWGLVVLEILE